MCPVGWICYPNTASFVDYSSPDGIVWTEYHHTRPLRGMATVSSTVMESTLK